MANHIMDMGICKCRPSRRDKTWDLIHTWTSLVCTAFMLLLSVTGLPLIFHEEIDHLLGYAAHPPAAVEVTEPAALDDIVAAASARKPTDAVQFLVHLAWLHRDKGGLKNGERMQGHAAQGQRGRLRD